MENSLDIGKQAIVALHWLDCDSLKTDCLQQKVNPLPPSIDEKKLFSAHSGPMFLRI